MTVIKEELEDFKRRARENRWLSILQKYGYGALYADEEYKKYKDEVSDERINDLYTESGIKGSCRCSYQEIFAMGIEPMSLEEAKELFGDDFDPENPEDMSEDEYIAHVNSTEFQFYLNHAKGLEVATEEVSEE